MSPADFILDIYDDPQGQVLAQALRGQNVSIPEKLASSQMLSAEDRALLPDRLFALVGESPDGHVLRKYAMHDEGHILTSIVYLMRQGHQLSDDNVKVAAGNLVNACEWYDIDPPDGLVKLALLGKVLGTGMGVADMSSRVGATQSKSQQNRQSFLRAQQGDLSPAPKVAGQEIELSPSQEKAVVGEGSSPNHVDQGLNRYPSREKAWASLEDAISGTADTREKKSSADFIDTLTEDQILEDPHFDPKGGYHSTQELRQKYKAYAAGDKQHWFAGSHGLHAEMYGKKTADLNGTEMMPHGITSQPAGPNTSKTRASIKRASWDRAGVVEAAAPVKELVKHANFALPHIKRYPIDSVAQVKTAEAYFQDHFADFPALERRVFANSVWDRAQELNVKVAGRLLDYAGDGYGPHIANELTARIARFAGTGYEAAYEVALEKLAELDPAVMVSVLSSIDAETGAHNAYGRAVTGYRDPYAAVYGSAKTAAEELPEEETYTWVGETDVVTGRDLVSFARLAAPGSNDTFGEGFAKEFCKDPIAMFKSMPDPQKIVLGRMARSGEGGASKL